MELYESKNDFILVKNDKAVFCDRITGKLTAQSADNLCKAWNPVCLGQVAGLIGKIKYHPDSVWRLLLIRNSEKIGVLPGGASVFLITRIAVLPLTADPADLDIELCKRHHFGMKRTEKIMHSPDDQKPMLKAFQQFRTVAENVKPKKKEVRDRERFENRVHEELVKIFEEDCSFYFSPDGDITNTLQRQRSRANDGKNDCSPETWRHCDPRFFWNAKLLADLTDQRPAAPEAASEFILPIVQGFFQIEELVLSPPGASLLTALPKTELEKEEEEEEEGIRLTLALVSRRSKERAGTRFRRRGVDENGSVANFVETEQIMEIQHDRGAHIVSYLQVRGSVPLFWSQSGMKYRPPPKLERSDEANEAAFCNHFEEQLRTYNQLVSVSLVETTGVSEGLIADAFLRHVILFNSPKLTFITFDFHDYCRKMHFENVSFLLEGLTEIFRDMKYFWADSSGTISEQKSVFRINCIDCLDRTNVVQTSIARVVIETQLRKLGLLYPDDSLPDSFQRAFQSMWANNGDSISRQYASTPALKGDYTRTGERTFNGMMRDGMNSANRYFWRLKEFHRQLAIDVLLGNEEQSPEIELIRQTSLVDNLAILKQKEDNMKLLIDRCRSLCMTSDEEYVGGWGLISSNESDSSQQDMDSVLLIGSKNYYVVRFKSSAPALAQRVPVTTVRRIELGLEPSVFKSRARFAMRVHFDAGDGPGCYHAFRQPQFRLFNNMLVPVRSEDEALESLRAIAESFNCAAMMGGLAPNETFQVVELRKLERRKTKPHPAELTLPIDPETLRVELPAQWQRVIGSGSTEAAGSRRGSVQSQLRTKLGNMKVRLPDLRRKFLSTPPALKPAAPASKSESAECGGHDLEEHEMSDSEAEILYILHGQEEEEDEEEEETEEAEEEEEEQEEEVMMTCKAPVNIKSAEKSAVEETTDSTSPTASDVILPSCGIVATSQELWDSLPQTVDELALSEDQFALALVQDVARRKTGGQEMRRHVERISLQLSFDDNLSPKLFSSAVVPATPGGTIEEEREESERFNFEGLGGQGGLAVPDGRPTDNVALLKTSRSETAIGRQKEAAAPAAAKSAAAGGGQGAAPSAGASGSGAGSPVRAVRQLAAEAQRAPSPLAFLSSRFSPAAPRDLEAEEEKLRSRAAALKVELPTIRMGPSFARTQARLRRRQLALAARAVELRAKVERPENDIIIF